MRRTLGLLAVFLAICGALAPAAARAGDAHEGGVLFAQALQVLERQLPSQRGALRERAPAWRERARSAASLAEERAVLFDFLALIPASHVGLFSGHGYRALVTDLGEKERYGLGFEVIRLDGGYFVASVLSGSPADQAGVRRGDRLCAIDGEDVETSGRLDHRTDDAHLPDPPAHYVLFSEEGAVRLALQRVRDGPSIDVVVTPRKFCTIDLNRQAVELAGDPGARIGVVPLSLMYRHGAAKLVREALDGPLAEADAVVFDVRGHGGSAQAVWEVTVALRADRKKRGRPFVFLADARTRSAKEMLLQRVRAHGLGLIVGEHTAGAVRPCSFYPLGQDTWLMCPVKDIDETWSLELVGLEPDVRVSSQVPYAAGRDAIFEFGVLIALEQIGAAAIR